MKKVLFVCTGNTCRSSMAEGIFKKILQDLGKQDEIQVDSCGIFARVGDAASPNAIKVLKNEGIDISDHRTKPMTKQSLDEADLILTMTKSHKNYILDLFPYTKGKVYVLGEFAEGKGDEEFDVSDPFGGDEKVYKQAAEEIKQYLQKVLQRLEKN